jgi:hypothetical protein
MAEAGKPKFGAFESLAKQAKTENSLLKSGPSAGEKSAMAVQESVPGPTVGESAVEKGELKRPRISKPVLTNEIEVEVKRLATAAAEKATMNRLYGKRVTYKGPRVTRSYKIEIFVDKWLDAISNETGIEKSTMVTKAIVEYISKDYSHLKPQEEEFSDVQH